MRKWWKRRIPYQPEAVLMVKDQKGDVIGKITLNFDGSFIGQLEPGSYWDTFEDFLNIGMFTDGVLIRPLYKPPTVPWKRKS